ncbi:sigma-70 family RNA polymerase sigma factor [Gordonia terrae]|uniref:sigma-70 family RNA polymerase sigma factor n=1 Tax=Gordonia terrae TaxID=2055 RepID=UPI003F6D198D
MAADEGNTVTEAVPGGGGDAQALRTLLASVSVGDREAFARLYDLTSSRIYGLAVRIVRDREYAQEVVQEAYLQYWLKAGDYDPARGSVITWMMTIAHRRAVDRVRSESTQTERLSEYGVRAAEPEAPRNIPLETVVRAAESGVLRNCLGQLTALQRESIEMSYFGGLTYPEVAERTDTALPTTKSRIRDGLKRLRKCMDSQRER